MICDQCETVAHCTKYGCIPERIGKPKPAAQPAFVQEPVAWMTQARNFVHVMEFTEAEAKLYGWMPVYTSPPAAQRQWVGLTDDERLEVAEIDGADEWFWKVCKAIEAKLKEKNT
jgi:hypothetical protein